MLFHTVLFNYVINQMSGTWYLTQFRATATHNTFFIVLANLIIFYIINPNNEEILHAQTLNDVISFFFDIFSLPLRPI